MAAGSAAGAARAPAPHRAASVERQLHVALLVLVFALPLKSVLDLDRVLAIGSLSVVSLTKLAGLWFFVSFLRHARTVRSDFRVDALHVLLFGLLALAVASTLQARAPAAAAATTFRYASFIALFFAFTQLLADPSVQLRTVWVLVTSCAVAGGISLRGFLLGQSPIATLPYGDPNDVAFMLATTLPLGIWLVARAHESRANTPWRALVLIAIAAVMVTTVALSVMFSFSRGALVGLGAAALFQIACDRRRARTVVIGFLVALLAVALLALVNPAHVLRGVQSKQQVGWANVTNRLQAWGEAVRLTEEHPLLGVGPGNFQFYYAERRQPGAHRLRVVHNTLLDIAVELGVPALCLFLAYIGVSLARLTVVARRPQALPGFAASLRSALIVAVVAGLFVSEQFFPPFWVLGALAYGVWRAQQNQGVPGR